jgi:ADP-ribosyl-[dinitrogen reductase] hydrolase
MELTAAQRDRVCGVLLGTVAGDALGAPFEFGGPLGPTSGSTSTTRSANARCGKPANGPMTRRWRSRSPRSPPPARISGRRPRRTRLCDQWASAPGIKDVGIQTSGVLSTAAQHGISAATARAASAALHEETGKTAGNEALMQTAPVALAYLDDDQGVVEAALRVCCRAARSATRSWSVNPMCGSGWTTSILAVAPARADRRLDGVAC